MAYNFETMDRYKDSRLTKTEISNEIGISRPTLNLWEKKYQQELLLRDATATSDRLRKLEWAVEVFVDGHNADTLIEAVEIRRREFITSLRGDKPYAPLVEAYKHAYDAYVSEPTTATGVAMDEARDDISEFENGENPIIEGMMHSISSIITNGAVGRAKTRAGKVKAYEDIREEVFASLNAIATLDIKS